MPNLLNTAVAKTARRDSQPMYKPGVARAYNRPARSIMLVLALILFGRLIRSAVIKSPTFDEPFHLALGYTAWQTGEWLSSAKMPRYHNL